MNTLAAFSDCPFHIPIIVATAALIAVPAIRGLFRLVRGRKAKPRPFVDDDETDPYEPKDEDADASELLEPEEASPRISHSGSEEPEDDIIPVTKE